jgi:hypothetical protein
MEETKVYRVNVKLKLGPAFFALAFLDLLVFLALVIYLITAPAGPEKSAMTPKAILAAFLVSAVIVAFMIKSLLSNRPPEKTSSDPQIPPIIH